MQQMWEAKISKLESSPYTDSGGVLPAPEASEGVNEVVHGSLEDRAEATNEHEQPVSSGLLDESQ